MWTTKDPPIATNNPNTMSAIPKVNSKVEGLGTLTKKVITCSFDIRDGDITGKVIFKIIEADQAAIDNGLTAFARLPERVTVIDITDGNGVAPDDGSTVRELLINCLNWQLGSSSDAEHLCVLKGVLHELLRFGVDVDLLVGDEN